MASGEASQMHPARILVSSTRKPVSYVNVAKRFLQEHGEVQVSALGSAVSTAVSVAEILKTRKLAIEKQIQTSIEISGAPPRERQKPRIDIVLVKAAQFHEIMAARSHANSPESSTSSPTERDGADVPVSRRSKQRGTASSSKQPKPFVESLLPQGLLEEPPLASGYSRSRPPDSRHFNK